MRNFNLHYHSSVRLCHACSTNIRDHVLQSRCCMFQLRVVGLYFSYVLRKDERRKEDVGWRKLCLALIKEALVFCRRELLTAVVAVRFSSKTTHALFELSF